VIRQVWITFHSGVLSKRPTCSDEGFLLIKADLAPHSLGRKARFLEVQRGLLSLPAPMECMSLSPSEAARFGRRLGKLPLEAVFPFSLTQEASFAGSREPNMTS